MSDLLHFCCAENEMRMQRFFCVFAVSPVIRCHKHLTRGKCAGRMTAPPCRYQSPALSSFWVRSPATDSSREECHVHRNCCWGRRCAKHWFFKFKKCRSHSLLAVANHLLCQALGLTLVIRLDMMVFLGVCLARWGQLCYSAS